MKMKTGGLLAGFLLFILPVVLTGCGGSGASSSSNHSASLSSATIVKNNGTQTSIPSYQITITPSGGVTYQVQIPGQPVQSGSNVLPTTSAEQFFQDLAAVSSLSKPPTTLPVPSGTGLLYVDYQSQQVQLNGTNDTKAQTLAADSAAIAQALGIPNSSIQY
jgi:hypothetical protein